METDGGETRLGNARQWSWDRHELRVLDDQHHRFQVRRHQVAAPSVFGVGLERDSEQVVDDGKPARFGSPSAPRRRRWPPRPAGPARRRPGRRSSCPDRAVGCTTTAAGDRGRSTTTAPRGRSRPPGVRLARLPASPSGIRMKARPSASVVRIGTPRLGSLRRSLPKAMPRTSPSRGSPVSASMTVRSRLDPGSRARPVGESPPSSGSVGGRPGPGASSARGRGRRAPRGRGRGG